MIKAEEDITESIGQAKGLKRPVIEILPSEEQGKIILRTYVYMTPPSNKAWGATSEVIDEIYDDTIDLTPVVNERLAYIDGEIKKFNEKGFYESSETMQYIGEYSGNYRRI